MIKDNADIMYNNRYNNSNNYHQHKNHPESNGSSDSQNRESEEISQDTTSSSITDPISTANLVRESDSDANVHLHDQVIGQHLSNKNSLQSQDYNHCSTDRSEAAFLNNASQTCHTDSDCAKAAFDSAEAACDCAEDKCDSADTESSGFSCGHSDHDQNSCSCTPHRSNCRQKKVASCNKRLANYNCMNPYSDIVTLAAIAGKISTCLDDDELGLLSANLVVLGDMLAQISVKRSACCADVEDSVSGDTSNSTIPLN